LDYKPNHSRTTLINDNIDSQLDEHLDRVYNNHNANKSINSNMSKRSPRFKPNTTLNVTELTGSFISNNNNNNQYNHDPTTNHHNNPLNRSNTNYSFNTGKQNPYSVSATSSRRSLNPYETAGQQLQQQQHHYYQLTAVSKEVDIDTHYNEPVMTKSRQGYADNGLPSTRSEVAIDRINGWLSQNSNEKKHQPTPQAHPAEVTQAKTKVVYFLPGEDLAYKSTFNGKFLTLAQFKQLLPARSGHFKCVFIFKYY
jgi:hypothetical protein